MAKWAPALPQLGCTKDELDTPALCLDLEVMDANMRAIVSRCRANSVAWRPHAKGHKSSEIARREVAAGAIGATCAKLAEAEVLAAGGVTDLLIANMVVGPAKMARLVALRRVADPIVCADHADQADALWRAMNAAGLSLRVLIEVDIGLRRVGTLPGEPTLELAKHIRSLPGLNLAGIMGYEGHLLAVEDPAEKRQEIGESISKLVATADLLSRHGMPCGIVSCGGTGSLLITPELPGITEIQAGGAVFMDAYYRHKCQVRDLEFALSIVATVVSRPAADRAIVDAGRKAMNMEVHIPIVKDHPGLRIAGLSAEHGTLEVAASASNLAVGDRLEFIPGYADLTTVLFNHFYGFRGGRLTEILPIEARGLLT